MKHLQQIFDLLETTHPQTMLEELGHYPHFQMLIMTLLSARTKDSTVIPIVKEMFKKYPKPEDYVDMEQTKLENMIRKIGFFRTKAKHIIKLSQILLETHNGKVPDTLKDLTSLPGVGRKTANCMLAYAFNKPAIAVDIHVHRIANRLGWIHTETPEKSEFALMELIPKQDWINVNRLLVGHGQSICKPINPDCHKCPIVEYCKFGKSLIK